jgi:uncharacterized protein YlzI (FlbEa/FlbD family)
VIKVNLISGGTYYLNPECIERIYATAPLPNNSVIVLSNGHPDMAVVESTDTLINAIRSDKRAGH